MEEWRHAPAAISHVYWHRKRQFEYACDRYDEWVLFAVTEGQFRYKIGGTSGVAGFGELVFCPPHEDFHREVTKPLSFHFYRFRWEPSLSEAGETRADGPLRQTADQPRADGPLRQTADQPRPEGAVPVLDHERLSSTYSYLGRLEGMNEERRLAAAQALFRDIWNLVAMEAEIRHQSGRDRKTDVEMEEAALWVREHAFEPVRLRDYCEARRMSAVHFTRRFQAARGVTPMEYLTAIRLDRARSLLLETTLTLDEIAAQCGYENGFYLSRVFKKKLKLSPSHFRRLNRL